MKAFVPMISTLAIAISGSSIALADAFNPWYSGNTAAKSAGIQLSERSIKAINTFDLSADFNAMASTLRTLAENGGELELSLPLPDGHFETFTVTQDSTLPESLRDRYPEVATFNAVSTQDTQTRGKIDVGPNGFHAMIFHDGEWFMIDPISRENTGQYQSYLAKNTVRQSQIRSEGVLKRADDLAILETAEKSIVARTSSNQIRQYTLAVATTGEYTNYFGGTTATYNAVVNAVTRINAVYEKDLAVTLQLATDTDDLFYPNANSDPFVNNNASTDIETVAEVIPSVIGASAFDVGHLFTTVGDGLAYLGTVCASERFPSSNAYYKAAGVSGYSEPNSDIFYISMLAHELGHQFGANHSFNGTGEGSCSTTNRNPSTAWEPGSGSTIMAYAGICGTQNLQTESSAFFHAGSIGEIQDYLGTTSCGVAQTLDNTAPTANAGSDHTIPANTPFFLTGAASDADGDTLSYIWEEKDTGTASSSSSNMGDDGTRPLFRSLEPSTRTTRFFPALADVIDGTLSIGEAYPTTTRELNFSFTVRDGNGGVAIDESVINVNSSVGPFVLNTPDQGDSWRAGETVTVEWDVANTYDAPVSCQNVDLLLSTNGGSSFSYIAYDTENDGYAEITLPTVSTGSSQSYLIIHCSDNVFYAINDRAFTTIAGSSSTAVSDVVDQSASRVSSVSSGTSTTTTGSTSESSSSGGGGGALSLPSTLLMVLVSVIGLMGCAQADKKHTQNSAASESEWTDPEADAKAALNKGDKRLWAVAGRDRIIPGVDSALSKDYSVRYLPNTDVLRQDQSDALTQQKALRDYAARYNRIIMDHTSGH
jgi:hypothetical protein